MAHEHAAPPAKTPWTKIFTAFKVALDLKKMLLAAAGILFASLGWFILSWVFYGMRTVPDWPVYQNAAGPNADIKAVWTDFKAARASWSLLHELAGNMERREDAADLATSLDEYLALDKWHKYEQRRLERVVIDGNQLVLGTNKYNVATVKEGVAPGHATVETIVFEDGEVIVLGDLKVKVLDGNIKKVREYVTAYPAPTLEERARWIDPDSRTAITARLKEQRYLPYGRLRTLPWFEDRGENPYLLVTDQIKAGSRTGGLGDFFDFLLFQEAPVVMEPLFKFLLPIRYLFDPRARSWDQLYLILVLLWTIAVWGFFGGAICRIAAVQFARNERITLREALLFTQERYVSYVVAPLFPLALVAILTVLLMVFGWLIWTPILGEIIAILWPIAILFGFVIAVVLVGLVGWPLMNATISAEGSDSFDALSRSYSYVYQAPWQYLWYTLLAVAYGAVVVFFVGFMASLLVYTGKWGVSSAWGLSKSDPAYDREPSYLFYYAPTSMGWKDLLISNSKHVVAVKDVTPTGRPVTRREFTKEYVAAMKWNNYMGSFLVQIWVWLLFLLVVGFAYSFFWSASTIIYFLMRHHVDDTDLDEVHLDDDGLDDPFTRPATPPPAAVAPPVPAKSGTISLNVVDAPALPPSPPPPPPPPVAPLAPPPAPPAPGEPPSGPSSVRVEDTLPPARTDGQQP